MSRHKRTRVASQRDYNSSEAAFKNTETKIGSGFKNTIALLPQETGNEKSGIFAISKSTKNN